MIPTLNQEAIRMSLKRLMDERDLTVEQLHDLSKVGERTIRRLRNGEETKSPKQTTINRLAKVLKVPNKELKDCLQSVMPSNDVSKLVDEQLKTLSRMSLEFEPPEKFSEQPIWQFIQDDIRGDFSYFYDEFAKNVQKAQDEEEFNELRKLVFYCVAYLLELSTEIDLKKTSLIKLKDAANQWELRAFINTKLNKLENIEFKLEHHHDGITRLATDDRAHQIPVNTSTDPMMLLMELANQINAQEPLDLPSKENKKPKLASINPGQFRPGNNGDLEQAKAFLEDLNNQILALNNTKDNIFAFDNFSSVPDDLAVLLDQYLPELRVMLLQVDDGETILYPGLKIDVFLKRMLVLVDGREKALFGETTTDEGKPMKNTTINVNAPAENLAIVDGNLQIKTSSTHNELIQVLRELNDMLAPTSSPESTEMQALQDVIDADLKEPEHLISKTKQALQTVAKVINKGSKAWSLYEKALKLLSGLSGLVV